MNNNSLSGQIDLLAISGARFENGNIIIPSSKAPAPQKSTLRIIIAAPVAQNRLRISTNYDYTCY